MVVYPRNMSNKQKKSYFYPVNQETAEFISERLWSDFDNGKTETAEEE